MEKSSIASIFSNIFFSHAEESTYGVPLVEGAPYTIRCREPKACRGADGVVVIWCIYLYHPSQNIELCFNRSSGETNATNYAMRLGLSKLFNVQVKITTSCGNS